ncbi:probable membrane-associated kinase regulator 2 [Zingiber officinale]|uniref:probable membrane-associated kinase regulator 2 n=1 Tax=Zingiber officinale TaxID=94328 RepID=UPI001C4AB998|nr:probable membrane-associated kinase regulator 2 [Zingiber officinale]
MDSFSFLKYLRSGGGGGGGGGGEASSHAVDPTGAGSTLAASVLCSSSDNEEEDDDSGDDEGPFFDLEFAAVSDGEEEDASEEKSLEEMTGAGKEVEREFNFAVSSDGSGDGVGFDTLSSSDDLLLKGKFVHFDPSSIVVADGSGSEADSKPQLPAYFLRTATKFRVFLLGLRKPKLLPEEDEPAAEVSGSIATEAAASASPKKEQPQQNKFFIKFKVVEAPLVSFFLKDGGSRSTGGGRAAKPLAEESTVAGAPTTEAEKKLVREMLQKYLDKIKPLYVRVSRKYAERLRLTSHLPPAADAVAAEPIAAEVEAEETDAESEDAPPPPPPQAEEAAPPVTLPAEETLEPSPQPVSFAVAGGGKILAAGLRVVCKRLGKSRSASAAVAAVPSPPPRRRDDSLLQQQDGIQSAIAHCKRSFTVAEQSSETPLARSMSNPGDGRAEAST